MAVMTNFKSFGRGALFALVAASATVATTYKTDTKKKK